MDISLAQLQEICTRAPLDRLAAFRQPLIETFAQFDINTPVRAAAFLAQCAHESAQFLYTRELASGEYYEPGTTEGSLLGNTQPGDGPRYKGGGLIQITGRYNYLMCGRALGIDLIGNPEQITQPDIAAKVSGWFWQTHGLNAFADINAFGTITHRINGGYNGLDSRLNFWILARKALSVD